jgi:hypothetical protein
MSQSRQPKGTSRGGEFAESKNPEMDVDLTQAPRPVASTDEIVKAISDLDDARYFAKDTIVLDERINTAINKLLSLRLPEPSVENPSVLGWDIKRANESLADWYNARVEPLTQDEWAEASKRVDEWHNELLDSAISERMFSEIAATISRRYPHSDHSDLPMDRCAIADRLHQEFDMPGDTSAAVRFEPNDFGARLIKESSLEIEQETAWPLGAAWTGTLRIGVDSFHVLNTGNGGPNHYSHASGDSLSALMNADEWNLLVRKGFPGLKGPNPLDDFCTILSVAKTP